MITHKRYMILLFFVALSIHAFGWMSGGYLYPGTTSTNSTSPLHTANYQEITVDVLQTLLNNYSTISYSIDSLHDAHKVSEDRILKSNQQIITANELIRSLENETSSKASKQLYDSLAIAVEIALRDSISQLQEEIIAEANDVICRHELAQTDNHAELSVLDLQGVNLITEIKGITQSLSGSIVVQYRGIKYLLFIANPEKHEIYMHLQDPDDCKPLNSIGAVLDLYGNNRKNVQLITNAGMYTQSRDPQGLFIENYEEIRKIDLNGRIAKTNFYLKPNGVFYISSNGQAKVKTTEAFQEIYERGDIFIQFATQSGPMLVIDGAMHPAFMHRSKKSTYQKRRWSNGGWGCRFCHIT